MFHDAGQVLHVDRWQHVLAFVDAWQGSKIWVKRQPGSPEELIENVVSLAMAVWKPTADNSHLDVLVELGSGHCKVL